MSFISSSYKTYYLWLQCSPAVSQLFLSISTPGNMSSSGFPLSYAGIAICSNAWKVQDYFLPRILCLSHGNKTVLILSGILVHGLRSIYEPCRMHVLQPGGRLPWNSGIWLFDGWKKPLRISWFLFFANLRLNIWFMNFGFSSSFPSALD